MDADGNLGPDFWPSPDAFLDLRQANEFRDESARCAGVAICDSNGRPSTYFAQGETAHVFFVFDIIEARPVFSVGVELVDDSGRVIHGKNSLQHGVQPPIAKGGDVLRVHQSVKLRVAPGRYHLTVGLGSVSGDVYGRLRAGLIPHSELASNTVEHSRLVDAAVVQVGFDRAGQLQHHGAADLPGSCDISLASAAGAPPLPAPEPNSACSSPTVFHVTHWKAGSQWIHSILRRCVPPDRIVAPQAGELQFLNWPLRPGGVYPTVYVTRSQFAAAQLPNEWRKFIVIRDLRDTLVSAYFSIKFSHPVISPEIAHWRGLLRSMDIADGLVYLMDEWLPASARIQLSWIEAQDKVIRYEDLLEHDLEILEPLLVEECDIAVPPERVRQAILDSRFDRLSGGRERGHEDIMAHERKGIAGDWRNYFDGRVKQAFKVRYGHYLTATGYECDLDW